MASNIKLLGCMSHKCGGGAGIIIIITIVIGMSIISIVRRISAYTRNVIFSQCAAYTRNVQHNHHQFVFDARVAVALLSSFCESLRSRSC